MININIDFWYLPDPYQLGMAYSLCPSRFTLRNPNIFNLVCTRIPTLAREQRAVWLFITLAKTFFFIDYLIFREDEALKTLAYYHANGNSYVYHMPSDINST